MAAFCMVVFRAGAVIHRVYYCTNEGSQDVIACWGRRDLRGRCRRSLSCGIDELLYLLAARTMNWGNASVGFFWRDEKHAWVGQIRLISGDVPKAISMSLISLPVR